jgi:ribulose-phosphate 3-epimerase
MNIQIAPSVLAADFGRIGDAVTAADAAGADLIHFDVMDGKFVPNLTFGPPLISAVRGLSGLPFDVHLMMERPWDLLREFADAGANNITVHAEACADLNWVIHKIRALGPTAGVALNPHTPVEAVRYVLGDIALLLIMTVSPGFGGQRYTEAMSKKIADAAALVREVNPECRIEVDGGINVDTAPLVVRAGASVLVAGTAVFGAPSVEQGIAALRGAVSGVNA